uniref:Fungal lipase-like domain-containing protein n=1 Tax=Leersia perrieri TaxID=77586 RepID=A0A0D9XH03_9ORYZ
MSLACGLPLLECVYCLGCARWAWKRCLHSGDRDSATWGLAAAADFAPVPRLCRLIMANYGDHHHPSLDARFLVRRRTYADTRGRVTPYLLYLDHPNSDIVLALRGLNLAIETDYALLLDNRLGKRRFDGGYVHNGLLRAAACVLDAECDLLRDLLVQFPGYTLTFTGHSLGAGIAAMLAVVVVLNLDKLGVHLHRSRIRCYAIAPARCMSLNLAIRYADVINSVVLQLAMPAVYQMFEGHLHTRRCYVKRSKEALRTRCGRYPPVVKTAVPVDGRFEHIVLSCNATMDHAIIWIEREAQKALDLMLEKEKTMEVPSEQRMERNESLQREHVEEHKAALRRAVTLSVPDARSPSAYGTFGEQPERCESFPSATTLARQRMSWNDLIERVFDRDESGHIVLRSSSPSP